MHLLRLLIFVIGFTLTIHSVKAQGVAVKTNLIADATTTMNLAVEIGIARKSSLDISVNYNPWEFSDHKQFKLLMVQPEYRYWFCENFLGSFVGLHIHGGIFNIANVKAPFGAWKELRTGRYEGEFIGLGLSYGYQWVLARHWNLEANIGGGYAYINYDRYQCGECGKRIEKGKNDHYFGITKAAISIMYVF